ncbi:cystatin-2-like [Dermacentor albipictus]|uniref:cystatin-2-like n=1 Tax=Dermacentor albipictus TaxID=60249 RepID=UPI0038FCC8BA
MGKYEYGRGTPQFPTFLLLLLLTFEATRCHRSPPGGWVQKDPSEPRFLDAARFAERKAVVPGGRIYRVLQVLSAWTQVVNGINYRVLYTRGPKCGPAERWRICNENPYEPTESCMAVVYAPFGSSRRRLAAHSCSQWQEGVKGQAVKGQAVKGQAVYGK